MRHDLCMWGGGTPFLSYKPSLLSFNNITKILTSWRLNTKAHFEVGECVVGGKNLENNEWPLNICYNLCYICSDATNHSASIVSSTRGLCFLSAPSRSPACYHATKASNPSSSKVGFPIIEEDNWFLAQLVR